MSGNKVVLDTNVIIFASKQLLNIEKFINDFDEFFVSVITYMEVYSYVFLNNNEKKLIDELFKSVTITHINKEIADLAISIRKNKDKKIKLPDAIILATSLFLRIPLLTDDWDDFENIDSKATVLNVENYKM